MERKNAWEKYDESGKKDVFGFSEKYRKFISSCKTERECVKESVELAKAAGYKDLYEVIKITRHFQQVIKYMPLI